MFPLLSTARSLGLARRALLAGPRSPEKPPKPNLVVPAKVVILSPPLMPDRPLAATAMLTNAAVAITIRQAESRSMRTAEPPSSVVPKTDCRRFPGSCQRAVRRHFKGLILTAAVER